MRKTPQNPANAPAGPCVFRKYIRTLIALLILSGVCIPFSGLRAGPASGGGNTPRSAPVLVENNPSALAGKSANFATMDLTGPLGSGRFGNEVKILPNGNFVVTDPEFDMGTTVDVGAVHLYDGTTLQIISTLTGAFANDRVGSGGVKVLPNSNFVVTSLRWRNPATSIALAGAVTFCSGTTGCSGVATVANSLVGSTMEDQVGLGGVTVLPNGNYLVSSYRWDNAAATAVDAGAITWCSGTSGCTGEVGSSNSLVGGSTNDLVGSGYLFGVKPFTFLSTGDFVVRSPFWNNPAGPVVGVGAATKCSGTAGCTGLVSSANSLVGVSPNDAAGIGGVEPLAGGAYIVNSYRWDNAAGPIADAGAVTWCNGTTGCNGQITSANSLSGSTNADLVGLGGVFALSNGNYSVASYFWDNPSGPIVNAGAATWCNGSSGCYRNRFGIEFLVGSTVDDQVGLGGITGLTNGNFVVRSYLWNNPAGPVVDAGAVTWCNGTAACVGSVDFRKFIRRNDCRRPGGNWRYCCSFKWKLCRGQLQLGQSGRTDVQCRCSHLLRRYDRL